MDFASLFCIFILYFCNTLPFPASSYHPALRVIHGIESRSPNCFASRQRISFSPLLPMNLSREISISSAWITVISKFFPRQSRRRTSEEIKLRYDTNGDNRDWKQGKSFVLFSCYRPYNGDQRNAFPRFGNRLTVPPTDVTALSCRSREIEGKG